MKKITILFATLFLLVAFGNRASAQCGSDELSCSITIQCTDSYGDGWNGNTINVYQGTTLRGSVSLTSGSYGEFDVAICTGDSMRFEWVTGSLASEASFDILNGDGTLIVSGTGSSYSSGATITTAMPACPPCPKVQYFTSALSSTTATVSWVDPGTGTEWLYNLTPYSEPTGEWQTTTATSVSFTGLTPNTEYHLFVIAFCGAADSSLVASYTFRTECGAMSLPATENFSSYDITTQIPFCWNRIEEAVNYGDIMPYVYSYYGALYFYPHSGTQSIISPRVPLAANQLELVLSYRGDAELQVGYVTTSDPTTAVFHQVGAVGPTTYDNTTYEYTTEQYTISFDTVNTTDTIYVMFRTTQTIDYGSGYLQSVTFRQINNCPLADSLAVTATASGQVTLGWTCASGSQWQVAYGPQGFDPDTATSFITSGTMSATIDNLDNGQVYDFYVRTVCGSQYGYWSNVCTTIPNLHIVNAGNDTIVTCGSTIVDDGGLDGSITVGLQQTIVLMPAEVDQTIRIQGYAHMYSGYSSGYPNEMRIYAGVGTNGQLLAYYNSVDVNDIEITSEVGAMTISITNTNYSYYAAEGFRFYVSCVDMPDCVSPYGLTVSNIVGVGATVSWMYDTVLGQAPGFTIEVTTPDGTEVGNYTLSGDDRSYMITGLNERSKYHVSLNVNCSAVHTLEADFMTVCNSGGELEIGDGTSTDDYLPAYLYYGTSVTQQLFMSSEFDQDSVIYGFKVYMNSAAADETYLWDVFVDTTSQTTYSGTVDYVVPTQANRLFSGQVHLTQGWVTINFDSAFTLPAGKNLVLTVNDKSGASNYNTRYFRITNTDSVMAIYGYNYSGILDATNSNVFVNLDYGNQGTANYRNSIQFLTPCNTSGCVAPVIVSAEPTTNSVDLTWVPGGDETSWTVEYRSSSTDPWTEVVVGTTLTNYTITGLTPATTYAIRVVSLCGEDVSPRNISVTTLCAPEALPFAESFENFIASFWGDDQLESCWNRGTNYSYGGYYPYTYTWASFNGSTSLNFGGYKSYIVLPQMAARVDSLNIKFYALNSSPEYYNSAVEVGVCTDPGNPSTFTVIHTQPVMSGQWELVDVDFENYTAGDGRIFIRCTEDNYSSLYVDSVVVSMLPDCRRINGATVSNITTSSATLNIVDNHGYNNYIVYYSAVNDITTADSVVTTATTVNITGLDPNTLYYVWVVSSCSATSVSTPFSAEPFRTECEVIAIDADNYYLEEFEGGRFDCMSEESTGEVEWVMGTNVNSYYDDGVYARSGGHMAMISSQYPSGASAMLVLPTFNFANMNENAVFSFYRFHYRATDYSGAASHASGHLEVYYRTGISGDWTLITAVDSSFNNWSKVSITLPASQGAAIYQVAVKGTPNGNYSGIYLDDFKVSAPPTCITPTNVTVSNITERTATIHWTGSAPSYKVQYRPQGTLSWNARYAEDVNSLSISPLQMATLYDVRVTAVCSPFDQSEVSDVVTFTTDFCDNRAEVSNYNTTMTAGTNEHAPVNTNYYYSYAEILVDSTVLAGMTEVSGLSFYIDSVGGAMNMTNAVIYMANTSASSLSSFQYDSSFVEVFSGDISTNITGARRIGFNTPFVWDGHSNVIVGFYHTMSNGSTGSVVKFSAHQAAANKVYYGANGNTFTPDQANMLSSGSRGASNMVPDLTLISCLPTCFEPVVSKLNTTAESITVEWYNENAVVEMQIKLASESAWDSPETVNANQENIHSFTFDNLPGITAFDIRLRRDCTADGLDYSDWVELHATTDTACSIPTALTVSDVTGTSATIGWTDGPISGTAWEIHVWNGSFNQYYDVTTNPATITGLLPGGNYRAAVRAYCSSNNHVVGEFSDEITFTNICQPVTGLNASVSGNDVTLTWTPGEYNTQWVVSYGYYGFEPNDQLGYMLVNTPTATITGLGANAAPYSSKGVDDNKYTFRVRAICADGWNSAWCSDVNVTFQVGIDDVEESGTQFVLHPNPATDRVTLRIADFEGNAEVSVLSVDGRQMSSFSTQNQTLDFDVSAMPAGTYFVRVQSTGWTAVRKLIVK